ncbi:MAG: hypothetical protein SGJ13_02895 [Actinomycetota bacterium]|nr:hypothetical protein [Actinomycetota bacterium]
MNNRQRRARARRYERILAHLPARMVDGVDVPPELAMLLPDTEPMCRLNLRAGVNELTRRLLARYPTVQYLVYTLDILGGVHEVHRAEDVDAFTLEELADLHNDMLRDCLQPRSLVYVERTPSPRSIGPARWRALADSHTFPVLPADVVLAVPERDVFWSAAEQYGPDPFDDDVLGRRRLDMQAGHVRAAMGLDALPRAG